MATADVRAVWQRAVNRCFIQEDAKRAPKLACVQSSCATSKLFDAGAASAADKSDHADVNVTHFNQKSSFSSLTPDSRWWLQLQTNNGFKKGLTYEQLNALEDEIENFKFCNENKTCKGDASFGDENHDYSSSKEGIKEVYGKNSQLYSHPMDMMAKNETMEIDSVVCSVSKQTNDIFSDSDYSWIGIEKPQPWWRTTDRDELACFISRKLLKHFENCDLPPPKKYLWGQPCADNSDIKIRTSSFNWEAKSSVTSEFYFNFRTKGSLEPGLMHRSWGLQPIKDIHILIVTNIQELNLWKHSVIPKRVRGKQRRWQNRLMLKKSTLLHSFIYRLPNCLPISNGFNCCSWKLLTLRLRARISQSLLMSVWLFRG